MTDLEGQRGWQVPSRHRGHTPEPAESRELWRPGEAPSQATDTLGDTREPPGGEHEGNFSQWKDFVTASALRTPPGVDNESRLLGFQVLRKPQRLVQRKPLRSGRQWAGRPRGCPNTQPPAGAPGTPHSQAWQNCAGEREAGDLGKGCQRSQGCRPPRPTHGRPRGLLPSLRQGRAEEGPPPPYPPRLALQQECTQKVGETTAEERGEGAVSPRGGGLGEQMQEAEEARGWVGQPDVTAAHFSFQPFSYRKGVGRPTGSAVWLAFCPQHADAYGNA